MIIYMSDYSKLIVITNRKLCTNDYFKQLDKVLSLKPKSLILREKDLTLEQYTNLASYVLEICNKHNVTMFVHSNVETALKLNCRNIHFSIPKLRENKDTIYSFSKVSVSCHSAEDVKEAIECGATQIILGNIFETDCKKGLKGKGLEFLREICEMSTVPIYAIGGITPDNLTEVLENGASGGCMMSGFMRL